MTVEARVRRLTARSASAQTLGDELWSPMGAETDAYGTVDAEGFAVADGGICVSLRDLARLGRVVLDGGDDSAEAFAQDEHGAELPGGHYRNQWWVPPGRHHLLAIGVRGQFLYVDRGARTVIALLSTWPTSLDPDRHRAVMEAFRARVRQVSESAPAAAE
jgi:CubicO group peptidase (beta-lactamase class C family)